MSTDDTGKRNDRKDGNGEVSGVNREQSDANTPKTHTTLPKTHTHTAKKTICKSEQKNIQSQWLLSPDVASILDGAHLRSYGQPPLCPGNFEMIAPGPLWGKITALRATLFKENRCKNVFS
eukprot:GHVR01007296.1.p1 GENE.GHVR01007296.1~~GHVR01007296.1.p1  ORF type:complete len:121 (+),score=19.37 GHVR01007296.1:240-602(+)